jgi:hypothetical protein
MLPGSSEPAAEQSDDPACRHVGGPQHPKAPGPTIGTALNLFGMPSAAAGQEHVIWGEVESCRSHGSSDSANAAQGTEPGRQHHPGRELPDGLVTLSESGSASSSAGSKRQRADSGNSGSSESGDRADNAAVKKASRSPPDNSAAYCRTAGATPHAAASSAPSSSSSAAFAASGGAAPCAASAGDAPAASSTASVALGPSWSIGSQNHDAGQCKPCAHYWKPAGCKSGADCQFCHLCQRGVLQAKRKARDNELKAEKHRLQL